MTYFEKITRQQYDIDGVNEYIDYDDIKLPERATMRSAGYDIYAVTDIDIGPGETLKLPTGIRVKLEPDQFLLIVPRSGLGFKYKMQLQNTCGVIDADYSDSDNEGHIWVKFTNDNNEGKRLIVKKGEGLCQGIILNYGITSDDYVYRTRNGGFGSTTKN